MPNEGMALTAIIKAQLDEASIKREAERGGGIISKIFNRSGGAGGAAKGEDKATGILSKIQKGGAEQAMKLGGILGGVMVLSKIIADNPFFRGILQMLTTMITLVLMPLSFLFFTLIWPLLDEALPKMIKVMEEGFAFVEDMSKTRSEMDKAVSESALGGALDKIPGGSILQALGVSIAALLWQSGMAIGDALFDIGMWLGNALWDNILIHFFNLGTDIGEFFTGVLDTLSGGKDSLLEGLSPLKDWGSDTYSEMRAQVDSNIGALASWGSDVFGWMQMKIAAGINVLKDWGSGMFGWMQMKIAAGINVLKDWGSGMFGWMQMKIAAGINVLKDWGGDLYGWITGEIQSGLEALSGLGSFILREIKKKIGLGGGGGGGGSTKTKENTAPWYHKYLPTAEDFISRPGMGVQRFSSQDTIIGVKGGALAGFGEVLGGGGGGGDTIVKVYIDGKELRNLVRTEIQAMHGTLRRM